jgi:flagellum-specific peptidoglycan hydrolase FlgJ
MKPIIDNAQNFQNNWWASTTKYVVVILVPILILLFIFKVPKTNSQVKTTTDIPNKVQKPIENPKEKGEKDKAVAPTLSNIAVPSTDISPANVSELPEPDVKKYIGFWHKEAVAQMDKFGIPASITMAQAIIESRSGTSILAQSSKTEVRDKYGLVRRGANNHFGIKCHGKYCKVGHCSNQCDDSARDFFLIFDSPKASFKAHSEFLVNQARYKGLLKYGKNYKLWALKLREFGYATDPTYDKKLIGIIDKYELYKLDDL